MKQKIIVFTAFLFFLLIQWYSIYFMLYNHPGPLGLNDAASYIEQINFFREFPLSAPAIAPSNINKILHPYLFGLLASVTGLSAESMFHLNFYIGLFLMGITLTIFFKKIDQSPLFIGIAFLIFAFYEGNGSYHGFSWVVPSFYAIMFFLLASIALFYSKHHYLYGIPLIILLLLAHSTGIYLAGLLVTAVLLHEVLFKKTIDGLKKPVFFLLINLGVFLTSEYLYSIHLLPASFSSSFHSYQKIDLQHFILGTAFNDILQTIQRYAFAKYFYGIYTPLLAYGIYHALKEKQSALLSLFFSAFIGQLLISPFVAYNFRFFYPLEVLTWVVIAYGISKLILILFSRNPTNHNKPTKTIIRGIRTTGQWLLLGLSCLFIYNAVHQKAGHTYYMKFYCPMFFEQDTFMKYLQKYPGKKTGVYALNSGTYLGLKKPGMNPDFIFSPPGASIAQYPENWIVIGETLRLYNATNGGFRVVLPINGALEIKTAALEPGRYRVELIDTEIQETENLSLSVNGIVYTGWNQKPYHVLFPEENMYPPLLPPWYWFADTPWHLFKLPMRKNNIIRESHRYTIDFELSQPAKSISLFNKGATLYIAGMIKLVNVNTGRENLIDFYWGDENTLKNNITLAYKGKHYPLLWTDPKGAPGRNYLFRLEKNFRDVKAFSFYTNNLML
jgi:hypothetical protein